MAPRRHARLLFAAGALAALLPALSAQSPAPCDPKAANCPAKPAPNAHDQFPFPGDSPGADDPLAKPASPSSARPAAPSSTPGSFPYPGDPDPAASGSSSSSSSSADPDLPPDNPPEDTPGRRKLPKVTKLQTDEEREAEDVKVAKFYHDDGNLLGSYNRLKDAVSLIHDDADAWFLLGEVAGKLHKPTEAADAYRKFLDLESETRRAREARRELAALPPAPAPPTPPAADLPRPQ